MNSLSLSEVCHDLLVHLNLQTDLTGNLDRISTIISFGRQPKSKVLTGFCNCDIFCPSERILA